MRQTSLLAYTAIKESGLLGKRQKQAYEVLYAHGPLTGNELSEIMKISGQWKRCSELKKRGLAIEVGERDCRITGNLCILWDVTDNLPRKAISESQFTQKLANELLYTLIADKPEYSEALTYLNNKLNKKP